MNFDEIRPEPPKPPPCRLQCAFCGYEAPKPEYKHTCWSAILLSIALFMMPIGLSAVALIKLGSVT